jgi:hypothetical protein
MAIGFIIGKLLSSGAPGGAQLLFYHTTAAGTLQCGAETVEAHKKTSAGIADVHKKYLDFFAAVW